LGPPKVMKNRFSSATTLSGSATLPFVISTEAKRSGEICGFFPQFARTERSDGQEVYLGVRRRVGAVCIVSTIYSQCQ
jgi:hypothetical protein